MRKNRHKGFVIRGHGNSMDLWAYWRSDCWVGEAKNATKYQSAAEAEQVAAAQRVLGKTASVHRAP